MHHFHQKERHKMKFNRIAALFIVVCMMVAMLASCNNDDSGVNRRPDDGSAATLDANFPAGDYQGETFTFAKFTSRTSTSEYYCGEWIQADEITGVATNDAIFKRNDAAKTKYNIKIEERLLGEGFEDLDQFYKANDYCFDVIYSWGMRMAPAVTNNMLYDFRALDEAGYIDLEASYWNPAALDDLTIAGRTFLAVNDITMSKLSWSSCLFFNPQIIDDYGLENPHDLVASNQWTIDKFLEMVKSVHGELDGNGNTFTKDDQYGMIASSYDGVSLIHGCGISNTTKGADGKYTLAIGETKVVDLITKVRDVLNDKAYVFDQGDITSGADIGGMDEWEYTRSYFASGHSLFLSGSPELTREFRNMETGYGVVPYPKYDENQADYISPIDPAAGVFGIPNTIRNDSDQSTASYERTGRILEYLAYKSSEAGSVVDAYYETTIKDQRQTIEENKEMFDIVKATGRYEWTDIMQVGTGANGNGKTIGDTLLAMYESRGIASTYKQSETRLTKALEEIYNTVAGLQ